MKYLHVSKTFQVVPQADGTSKVIWHPGKTYNIGRNKAKRELRAGKARKHWQVLGRT